MKNVAPLSSWDSGLTIIRVNVLDVHVDTWVVEHCGSVVALCGRDLVPSVRQKINFVTCSWLHVTKRKSDT